MRTLKKNKDGFREEQLLSTCRIQLMRPIYVNNGLRKNGTVHSGILGEGQRKVRETSRQFSVARADVRSRVQTRWLRFVLIVNHNLSSSQMFFYALNGAKVYLIKKPSFIYVTDNKSINAEFTGRFYSSAERKKWDCFQNSTSECTAVNHFIAPNLQSIKIV